MRTKNRPIVFWKEPLVSVYLGDIVVCDAYITKSKSYFSPNYKKGVLEIRDSNNKLIEEVESGSTGELPRYDIKKPSRPFRGVCVGIANKNTVRREVFDDNDTITNWTVNNKQFLVVYYSNNKKRLVPLENVLRVYTSHTIKPWNQLGE